MEMAEKVMRTAELIAREWREDLTLVGAEEESVWRSRRAVLLDDTQELQQTLPAFTCDPNDNPDSPYRGGSCSATRLARAPPPPAIASHPSPNPSSHPSSLALIACRPTARARLLVSRRRR